MNEPITDWKEAILKKWNKDKPPGGKSAVVIKDAVRDRLAREFKGEVLTKEPMSRHTSIRIGGPADAFLVPSGLDDLIAALRIAREENIPFTMLGAGSNTLVKDGGIRGFVAVLGKFFAELQVAWESEIEADVAVGAGVGITAFVNFTRDLSLTGAEPLVGIPGTIGGAIVMNAGARGREIKDIVREITVLTREMETVKIPREKLEFEYRNLKIPRTHIVIGGLFRLHKGKAKEIAESVRNYQKKRVETQPLQFPNLGSVFKNPPPHKKRGVQLYAARLIDEAGLKNVRVGGARISEKHANFIINENNARAQDVIILIGLIKDRIRETTGVVLETEVKIVGEDS
ncbi:MAG: UDP-N-acetylmuramate dehydrogenase [Deltaproteobacteria bacterium]|nr:UDP-N-acetylmuramate dehydrogenase [Deltaproteobacteria bacterium]